MTQELYERIKSRILDCSCVYYRHNFHRLIIGKIGTHTHTHTHARTRAHSPGIYKKGNDTLSGEGNAVKIVCIPFKKGSTLKERNLLPFFNYGSLVSRQAIRKKSQNLCIPIKKMAGYLPSVSSLLYMWLWCYRRNWLLRCVVFIRKWQYFVCVEVLRPSQPNGVMSSAVSLPYHTFTGQN